MLVGISPDYLYKNQASTYVEKYAKILEFNKIDYAWISINDQHFWEKLPELDYFIFRFPHMESEKQIARDILPVIEKGYGIKCYPNQNSCWHYDDKVKQYFLMKAHGMPVVDSWVFYDKRKALDWAESTQYPVVYKLRGGASSQNVILVENKRHAKSLIKRQFGRGIKYFGFLDFNSSRWRDKIWSAEIRRIGGKIVRWLHGQDANLFWQVNKNYILFQKFLPGNDYDTRVITVGNRIFARQRKNREGDWRASGIGKNLGLEGFNYDPDLIDKKALKIALEVSSKLKFQYMAYDFLYDNEGNSKFCEISYTSGDSMFYAFPGFWDVNFEWHEGHYWPQYLQLMDLLGIPDLKQPHIDD